MPSPDMPKNLVPAEVFERARAAKFGVPYDPETDALLRGIVEWKRKNHRLQQGETRDAETLAADTRDRLTTPLSPKDTTTE